MRWTCSRCGEEHVGLPHDWAFDRPTYWEGPHDGSDFLDDDLCRWTDDVGEANYFIRGLVTIPVLDADDDLRYGVWSSLSKRSFARMLDHWDDPGRVNEPPYFGWFSNSLPGYPQTLSLPLEVVTDELENRPELVFHDGDHPLIREQRDGITTERVREIAELNLHP